MPHMETTQWNFKFDDPPFHHSVNLYPHPIGLGNAFRDLITLKNWKSFAILYEENEALVRMQEILKDPALNEKRIVVRQFPSDEYRTTFKELHKLAIRNIIVDVPHEHILTVLKHAQQVDMLSAYHNYFFISLDVHTVDLEEFQYSGLNISGFSLVDLSSKEVTQIVHKFQQSQQQSQIQDGIIGTDDSNTRYHWNPMDTNTNNNMMMANVGHNHHNHQTVVDNTIFRMVSSNNFTVSFFWTKLMMIRNYHSFDSILYLPNLIKFDQYRRKLLLFMMLFDYLLKHYMKLIKMDNIFNNRMIFHVKMKKSGNSVQLCQIICVMYVFCLFFFA